METTTNEDPSNIENQTPAQAILTKYARFMFNHCWEFVLCLYLLVALGQILELSLLWTWLPWPAVFMTIFAVIQSITSGIIITIARQPSPQRISTQLWRVLYGFFGGCLILFFGVYTWDPYYTMHYLCLFALISSVAMMGFIVILMISINRIKPGESPNVNTSS